MPNVHLQLAGPADAARLAGLMRACFLEAYAACSTPENVAAYLDEAFGPARQAAELAAPDRTTWIARDDDDWLGFAQMRIPSTPPAGVDLARPAQLHRLYLARGATGRGLGTRLLATVRDAAQAQGADGLWLSVWQRAPGPLAFYRREGFEVVGTAVFPVGTDPLQDWIMQARFRAA